MKSHGDARLFVITAADEFAARTWSARDQVLFNGDFSWVIHRAGEEGLELPTELMDEEWEALSALHLEHARTGAVIHGVDVNVGAAASTAAGQSAVDTVFHGVDLQWTFWEAVANRARARWRCPDRAPCWIKSWT